MKPPEKYGFSGTVKLYRRRHALEIAELELRGYTVVVEST